MNEEIMLFEEAAAFLRITPEELESLIQSSQLRYVLICEQARIRKSDVLNYIRQLSRL